MDHFKKLLSNNATNSKWSDLSDRSKQKKILKDSLRIILLKISGKNFI
jgi:hypothetical protein